MNETQIDLEQLLNACIDLSKRAGEVISKVHASGALQTQLKGVNDPVTQADLQSQRLIVCGLRKLWPSIAIVGEEGEYPLPDSTTPTPQIRGLIQHQNSVSKTVSLTDVAIFVDPLDATREFTLGNLEPVMVLIGITLKGKPYMGITHQPFLNPPRTCYGVVGSGVFGITPHPRNGWPKDSVLLASRSQDPKEVQEIGRLLKVQKTELAGGCANKMLLILEGKGDVYAMRGKGSKVWDTCAPHAIILAAGGFVSDAFGNELVYSAEKGAKVDNDHGLITTMSNSISEISILLNQH